ncbi:hypothetical protein P60_gp54 [Synechococcus phage P60]|uniref:Uncharacterized protein n=1 Tax=Synechococcus phage P60 TaxID=2905923 RepID=Q8W6Y3_9CAUD|nr:hypothetical protein P60_gp54 [Synechococcus phage P60]AAL73296.1 hypothetical protein P60_gp54 [Synechococcus phage P60]
MKLFRIYCGLDTNGQLHPEIARQTAERLALKFFPHGHTIYEARGRWMGEVVACTEDTMIIEVLLDERTGAQAKVYELAGAYKERCYQESVMITETQVEASFV